MTFRQRYFDHWLEKVRTLPEPVFRECVRRLQDGEAAISVGRWLVTVPKRGGLQDVTKIHTMRRYIEALRVAVLGAQKGAPPAGVTTKELNKAVEAERRRVDNSIAIMGGPLKREPASASPPPAARPEDASGRSTLTMIEYLVKRNAKNSERRDWLKAIAEINFGRLQLVRFLEEKMKLPLNEGTKISQIMINRAEADSRAALADLQIKKAKQQEAIDNFGAITIDDEPPATKPAHAHGESSDVPQNDNEHGESSDAPPNIVAATYTASPRLLEAIEVRASSSEEALTLASFVCHMALNMMYAVDVIGGDDDKATAEHMQPTPAKTVASTGITEKAQAAAAEHPVACRVSPEDSWEAELGTIDKDSLQRAAKRFAEGLPVVIKASPSDREAVASVFELMLIIMESGNIFEIQDQAANGTGGSPRRWKVTPENFEIVKEFVATCQNLSPEARALAMKIQALASEIVADEVSRLRRAAPSVQST